jgi:hypothetical protein
VEDSKTIVLIGLLGWYFWNETLDRLVGPYATREGALEALKRYTADLHDL